MSQPSVYVFWDNSNIFISAQLVAAQKESSVMSRDVRIHFKNLFILTLAGRPTAKAVAVGSVPPEQRDLWDRLAADTGIQPELYERGSSSGKEQGLDHCIQTHMLRALADETDPQIAVLLTGDGQGYEDGVGFHADLERMHKKGWGIEVIAWDRSCNGNLKRWAQSAGVYIPLESYYASVTFLEGTRSATTLSLLHRQKAQPRLSVTESTADRTKALEEENQRLRKEVNIQKYNEKIKRRSHSSKGGRGAKKH